MPLRLGLRRTALLASLAFAAATGMAPGAADAVPAPLRDAAHEPQRGRTFIAPFSDATTPCVLQFTANRHFAASPFSTPAQSLAACRTEADTGNFDARVVYGQLLLFGYAGRASDTGLGIIEDAAAEGSPVAERLLGALYHDGNRVPRDYDAARRWFARAAARADGASANALGMMNYNGEGGPVDFAAAYAAFAEAASDGDARGATNAGRILLAGRPGVAQDIRGSIGWLALGASRHDPDAQWLLGLSLLRGTGIERDVKNAAGWIDAAAGRGQLDAKATLADLYLSGTGVPRDDKRGFDLMLYAARRGSVYAQRRVGELYAAGIGTARNDTVARQWHRKAALSDDVIAQFELATEYRYGRGGPVDFEAAIGWMQGAAQAGLAAAQNDLGAMLQQGEGGKPDFRQAQQWYQRAADQGFGIASYNLASLAYRGLGMPPDKTRAYRLAQAGARAGYAPSAVMTAAMLYKGDGVAADLPGALAWYRKAADAGNVDAQRAAGWMYLRGEGGPRDVALAHRYFTLAAQAGDVYAQTLLAESLASQPAEADKKAARQWLDKALARKFGMAYAVMGEFHLSGNAAPRDPAAAAQWFRRGIEANDPLSQRLLCLGYVSDALPQISSGEALPACRAAAASGDALSMRQLAIGLGPREDARERVYWQWRIASTGDAAFETMLAKSYDMGDGIAMDFDAALYWLRRAAAQGNADAQSALAQHLLLGLGEPRNDQEAFAWASRASARNAQASMLMGLCYLNGRGVERDAALGRKWLEAAATAGSGEAARTLASLYEGTDDVAADDVAADEARAIDWYRKAAALGSDAAQIVLALRTRHEDGADAFSPRKAHWLVTGEEREPSTPSGRTDASASWKAFLSLNGALSGDPVEQYETGVRYLTGDGIARDKALGAAWLQRAGAGFAARAALRRYAEAVRGVEARVREAMTPDERDRARLLAAHLMQTVGPEPAAAGAPASMAEAHAPAGPAQAR
ncbi:sel1 repeat family protein [Trinickia caryophylli]|nr:sel1 repeat family protein [Trinickia caryophylli]